MVEQEEEEERGRVDPDLEDEDEEVEIEAEVSPDRFSSSAFCALRICWTIEFAPDPPDMPLSALLLLLCGTEYALDDDDGAVLLWFPAPLLLLLYL